MSDLGKLEEAVKTIRDECKSHEKCENCLLFNSAIDACNIARPSRPDTWVLKSDEPNSHSIFY